MLCFLLPGFAFFYVSSRMQKMFGQYCTSTQNHYTGGFQPLFTGGLENHLRWVPVEIKSFHTRVTQNRLQKQISTGGSFMPPACRNELSTGGSAMQPACRNELSTGGSHYLTAYIKNFKSPAHFQISPQRPFFHIIF